MAINLDAESETLFAEPMDFSSSDDDDHDDDLEILSAPQPTLALRGGTIGNVFQPRRHLSHGGLCCAQHLCYDEDGPFAGQSQEELRWHDFCVADSINSLSQKQQNWKRQRSELTDILLHGSEVDLHQIKWAAPDAHSNNLMRSALLSKHRARIQASAKYAQRKCAFMVEPNECNTDVKFTRPELRAIEVFFNRNHEGHLAPLTKASGRWMRIGEVLGTRTVSECEWNAALVGEVETYAKVDIDGGCILGQYVGSETTEAEWVTMYNGSRQEISHLKYLSGDTFRIRDGVKGEGSSSKPPPKKKRKLQGSKEEGNGGELVQFYIDPIAAESQSPLLRINDCRARIKELDISEADARRINCEMVSVLVNGWPSLLVRTTKSIARDESLFFFYGNEYATVLEQVWILEDVKSKHRKAAEQAMF